MKKKEYKVTTFAELRAAFEKAKADAEKKKQEMKPEDKQQVEDTAKQYRVRGRREGDRSEEDLAGYDTHEVILTITAHEKGKKVEESGGFVMTTDMWLAPKIAGLDELVQFQLKYMKAVYGEAFVGDMQQMASTRGDVSDVPADGRPRCRPRAASCRARPRSRRRPFDGVKSAEAMKEAKTQNQQPPRRPAAASAACSRRR